MSLRKQAQYSADEENAAMYQNHELTTSSNASLDSDHHPFLTLEENTTADTSMGGKLAISAAPSTIKTAAASTSPFSCSMKKAISYSVFGLLFFVIYDALFVPPEQRMFQPDAATDSFLLWVQGNPVKGLFAIILVIAAAVVVMVPIGTPLTLGCGYIYKGAYGWKVGLTLATMASMFGSALGAVICFLLGRYLLRDQVRQWARDKYPLFDAIDSAASEHGLRIMAMLYLTPILPLGPVSYMCGTTSMALSSFVLAKIAALPLMLLYCFIGASTRTLISSSGNTSSSDMKSIEENETLIVSGILLSFVMIAGITRYIKKELNTILERQEKHKPGERKHVDAEQKEDGVAGGSSSIELGTTSTTASARHRRAA